MLSLKLAIAIGLGALARLLWDSYKKNR